ncbi:MAG: nuclear transport factor 2 family protein [Stappiaceae bacterium]
MSEVHPNVSLLAKLDPRNLDAATDVFSQDVIWHYFNPNLPDIQGDYVGLAGLRSFFESLGHLTGGSFKVEPISVTPAGDELVVMRTRNTMTLQGQPVATDVAVVWRIVEGRIAEVWDIPSVYTMAEDA